MNLQHITRDYFRNRDPADINDGDCWLWAIVAHKLYGLQLWCSKHHVFVSKGWPSLYFDAEAPLGTTQQLDLPFYIRRPPDVIRSTSIAELRRASSWDEARVSRLVRL